LSCNVFYFRNFWWYFWPDFRSRDLRSFSPIPSMGLGARMRLIIYLQPWSESMALAPSIYGFLPFPPRPKFFEFIQNRKRNLWIWKKTYFRTCVHVSSNLVPRSSRIKVEKKVSGWIGHIWQFYRIYPVKLNISSSRPCPLDSFQRDVHSLFWSYFANRVHV
jgi:hypothetical protein